MKKALCITLIYAILMTMLVIAPFTANADEKNTASTDDTAASGTSGDCTWKIEDGVLIISGNGKMGGYDHCAPWHDYDFTEAVIEKGVTTIGDSAFSDCSSLTSVTIPDSVMSIGNAAFSGCSSLTRVTIPDSVTSIDGNTFVDCSTLTSITIGNSVTKIRNEMFYGCSSLTSVTIPDSVTSIGSFAFYGCSSLTSLTIGKSVTRIDSNAFCGCEKLSSVTIPASVNDIHNNAFGYYDVVGVDHVFKIEGFTIYGYIDSAAERYANDNGFKFISIDGQPTEPPTEPPTQAPTEPEIKQIKGDIDGDGKVSILDTTVIQRYLAGLETTVEGIGEPIE
nr:leucine-rich repeat protein [uncultured Ruminococcus sp.]